MRPADCAGLVLPTRHAFRCVERNVLRLCRFEQPVHVTDLSSLLAEMVHRLTTLEFSSLVQGVIGHRASR
jgi:hypothetical protein